MNIFYLQFTLFLCVFGILKSHNHSYLMRHIKQDMDNIKPQIETKEPQFVVYQNIHSYLIQHIKQKMDNYYHNYLMRDMNNYQNINNAHNNYKIFGHYNSIFNFLAHKYDCKMTVNSIFNFWDRTDCELSMIEKIIWLNL